VKETDVREQSVSSSHREGRVESVSEEPSEETNLLLTAPRDDDCLTPVNSFPRDIVKPVENLGEGIFGQVS